jgi:hypothetical protein
MAIREQAAAGQELVSMLVTSAPDILIDNKVGIAAFRTIMRMSAV